MARTQSLAKAEQPSAFEGFGCGARRKSTYETYVGVGGEWRRHHRVARCAQITNIVNFLTLTALTNNGSDGYDGSNISDWMDVTALTSLTHSSIAVSMSLGL